MVSVHNLSLFSYFLVIAEIAKGVRIWRQDSNFHSPTNWDHWPPCTKSRYTFPSKSPSVYVASGLSLGEIVLPLNGEIILGSDIIIKVSEQENAIESCSNTVNFVGTTPGDWFDTGSWCEGGEDGASCASSQPTRLHTEQVPCRHDDITFPPNKVFFVNVTFGSTIVVSRLTIGAQVHSTETLRTFLSSEAGRKQFVTSSDSVRMEVSEAACDDVTGCACGNDNGQVLERVCALERNRCSQPLCDAPLRPVGHCCDICGAILTADYGAGFRFETLKVLIREKFTTSNAVDSTLSVIVSKTSQQKIQVVFMDSSGGGEAADMARQFDAFIQKDNTQYGLVSPLTAFSGAASPSVGHHTGERLSGTSISVIILAIIFLLLLILLIVYLLKHPQRCRRPNLRLPRINTQAFEMFNIFKFKRFHESSAGAGNADFELSAQKEGYHTSYTSFDNPVYRDQGTIYPLSGIRSDITLDTHSTAAAYQPDPEPETLGSGNLDQATFELHSEHQPHMSFANPLYVPTTDAEPRVYQLQPVYDDDEEERREESVA